jgi:hypothetical protein
MALLTFTDQAAAVVLLSFLAEQPQAQEEQMRGAELLMLSEIMR